MLVVAQIWRNRKVTRTIAEKIDWHELRTLSFVDAILMESVTHFFKNKHYCIVCSRGRLRNLAVYAVNTCYVYGVYLFWQYTPIAEDIAEY